MAQNRIYSEDLMRAQLEISTGGSVMTSALRLHAQDASIGGLSLGSDSKVRLAQHQAKALLTLIPGTRLIICSLH